MECIGLRKIIPLKYFHIFTINKKQLTSMKQLTLLIATILFSTPLFSQQLVSITPLSSHSLSAVQSYTSVWSPAVSELNPVKSYKVVYNTTDAHGNATVASGAVYIPTLTNCDYAPILAYDHGTEFLRNNVPSKNKYTERAIYFSKTGFITVLPDYLGLGDNPGIHLYQHAETEATATLDLVRAVRQYLDTATNQLKDNGQFFITGYSQGGHAAMATNKYIEDHNLASEFNVIACAPLSGAFDQTGAQFDLIFDGDSNYYASPFLPYILASYQEAYGNLYQSYAAIYKPSHASQIETFVNSGNKTMTQWAIMLGTNYYGFMQDSVLQNILADVNRDTHPINKALRANNLYDWIPQNPIKMFYCGSDSMVAPANSTNTLDSMIALGATQIEAVNALQSGDHNSCFIPATKGALTWFNTLAVKCNYASVNALEKSAITLYPNPATNKLIIEGLELADYEVSIHSSLGQLFMSNSMVNNQIDVAGFPTGVYLITLRNKVDLSLKYLKFVKE